MMIIHDDITMPADGGAVIFAKLGGFTCSVCAPLAMTKAEVEAFAELELGPGGHAVNVVVVMTPAQGGHA